MEENILMKGKVPIPLPVVITRSDEWFIGTCQPLNLVTQGKTEEEVKENMKDLLDDYFSDPDTAKPNIETLLSVEVSNISVNVPQGVLYRKAQTA